MEFESPHVAEHHEKLGRYLQELFEDLYLDPDNGHFYVGYGSTVLEVSAEPYGPEDSVVRVTAYCVQGVELEEDLSLGLLELNHELPVGAFSLVGPDVFFSHTLFGRSLDRHNLLGTIAAVATVSDDYDERIVERFGGATALELIGETGGRRRRQARKD
jgi:hypothetical protein